MNLIIFLKKCCILEKLYKFLFSEGFLSNISTFIDLEISHLEEYHRIYKFRLNHDLLCKKWVVQPLKFLSIQIQIFKMPDSGERKITVSSGSFKIFGCFSGKHYAHWIVWIPKMKMILFQIFFNIFCLKDSFKHLICFESFLFEYLIIYFAKRISSELAIFLHLCF